MKHLIPLIALICALATVGCSKNKKATTEPSASINSSVTDITPTAQPPSAYQPAPQPAVGMTYDTTITSTPSSASPASTSIGGSYTVKKGDTLYGIARARYGDGKQYTRIVAANPGISPQSLRVGQTLVIP